MSKKITIKTTDSNGTSNDINIAIKGTTYQRDANDLNMKVKRKNK